MIKLSNKTIQRQGSDRNINKRTNQEIGHVHFPRWEIMTSRMTQEGKTLSAFSIGSVEEKAATTAKRWQFGTTWSPVVGAINRMARKHCNSCDLVTSMNDYGQKGINPRVGSN